MLHSRIFTDEPTLEHPVSQLCTQKQVDSRAYCRWCEDMREQPRYHRKQWEFCYILEALAEAGLLEPGCRGVGFGVGKEPLSALFANRGCDIVATDQPGSLPAAATWSQTGQHATSLDSLNDRGLCDPSLFAKRVTFAEADMNHVPDHLHGFDFVWSACALEHLGSLECGCRFIRRSLELLRPGGISVHTTEFNLSSDEETVEAGATVYYRRRDIVELAESLAREGHEMILNFHPGSGEIDGHIDEEPFSETHLKLRSAGCVATSFGLIIRKAPAVSVGFQNY